MPSSTAARRAAGLSRAARSALLAGQERAEHADRRRRGRVVVELADELVRREPLAREAVLTPERVVVDGEELRDAALGDRLLEPHGARREAQARSGSRPARFGGTATIAARRDDLPCPASTSTPSSGQRISRTERRARRARRAARPSGSGSAGSRRRRGRRGTARARRARTSRPRRRSPRALQEREASAPAS